jgi:dTDP-glucose 4,6-dehydratase
MAEKRILITGAAGFLGSHLCDRFIQEGFHVIAMDNLITGDMRNIEHLSDNPNFEFIFHDVTKHIDIPGKLDFILHFASPASPIDYLKIPIQTLKVVQGYWWHLPAKFTAILWYIHNRKSIGEM